MELFAFGDSWFAWRYTAWLPPLSKSPWGWDRGWVGWGGIEVEKRIHFLSPDQSINGTSFKLVSEDQWKTFGLTFGGQLIVLQQILKQV